MTEPVAPIPAATSSPRVKIVLAVSLALNLLILGLVGGAFLNDGPGKAAGLPRDVAFGPFSEAFSRGDRKALRAALMNKAPEFRASRAAAKAEFDALLVALRTQPFDAGALRLALGSIETRYADRLRFGRELIETRIATMSASDRIDFADRLQQVLDQTGRDLGRDKP